MNPQRLSQIIERGVAAHWASHVDEALACYRQALAMAPNDPEALSLTGLAMTHSDQAEQALPLLVRAVELDPAQVGFRLNLVEGLAKVGQYQRALSELQNVIAKHPANVRAWEKTAEIASARNDLDGAAAAWTQAISLNSNAVAPALNLARLEMSRGRFDMALRALDSAATRAPDHPAVFALRSEALTGLRDWAALQATATVWSRHSPENTDAWRAAARASFEQGRHVAASDAFSRILALATPTAVDLTAYAGLCLHALKIDAAATALGQAEALDPNYTEMLAKKALLLMYLGRFEEAEAYCRRCLEQDPENAPTYTILSRLRRGRLSAAELGVVQRLTQRQDIHLDRRIPAAFAIAHAYDARGDFDSAFAAYEYAHALGLERNELESRQYDPAQIERRAQRIIELSAALPLEKSGPGGTARPIFIVGMPRSGTTLVESVLSAHSRVFACGERPTMQQILRAVLRLDAAGHRVDERALGDWSAAYLGGLPDLGGADHITDKHPLNFEAVALITRLFPDAAIVHVRRNPVETCLSIYRQEFNKHWTFAHRWSDLGHFYGHYARLVAHWDRALPGRMMTIQYEDFTRNFERSAPELLRACGLAWEPQCLEFQKSSRAITTFSTVQARDPVTMGNGRAQRYAKHLDKLVTALEAAHIDLDTGALRT